MDELKFTVAAFFRNKGKNVVTEAEFVNGISLDLRWVAPSEAVRVPVLLVNKGYLKKEGEYLRPAFDVQTVDVPLNFRPSAEMFKVPLTNAPKRPEGVLSDLMDMADALGIGKKDFVVSVNAIQKRINVDIEIAALVLLGEKGADVSEHIDASYDLIAKR